MIGTLRVSLRGRTLSQGTHSRSARSLRASSLRTVARSVRGSTREVGGRFRGGETLPRASFLQRTFIQRTFIQRRCASSCSSSHFDQAGSAARLAIPISEHDHSAERQIFAAGNFISPFRFHPRGAHPVLSKVEPFQNTFRSPEECEGSLPRGSALPSALLRFERDRATRRVAGPWSGFPGGAGEGRGGAPSSGVRSLESRSVSIPPSRPESRKEHRDEQEAFCRRAALGGG